jgi:small subunit ribosomal protein S6
VNVTTPSASVRPRALGQAQVHSKEYETIYILRSDVDVETAERVQSRVAEAVDREHGKLVKVEAWGRRKLAYPVGKQRRGVYVYLKYVGGGGLVAEVERNLKLQDAVVKFMTVQTNDDVDLGAVQVDPEETKLGKLELPPEEAAEDSREKQLGLVDLGPDAPRSMRGPMDEGDEFEAEGGEPEGGGGGEPAAKKAEGGGTEGGGAGQSGEGEEG